MNDLSFLETFSGKKIVVAPLNWGLGHATRCVPIIRQLSQHNKVIIASDGIALTWLQQEFTHLAMITLPSYRIDYSSERMWYNMLRSSPRMINAIRQEHQQINAFAEKEGIDVVISDHRLGCYTDCCDTYIIAHQIQVPHANPVLRGMITAINKGYLNRYHQVWIPDYEILAERLAGVISSSSGLKNYRYIGPLSRLSVQELELDTDLLVMLSGPEPSRSILEGYIVASLHRNPQLRKVTVLRGTTDDRLDLDYDDRWEVIDLADSATLENRLNRAQLVLCRSGYSSIMDLHHLSKEAILIPTPQQPEQLFLADYLGDRPLYQVMTQEELMTHDF